MSEQQIVMPDDAPVKHGEEVRVLVNMASSGEPHWMKARVRKLISRVGRLGWVGFEINERDGLFLFEDVLGGSSDLCTWYSVNVPLGAHQLSLMWKNALGNERLSEMAHVLRDRLNNGRSDSDVITDLLGLLPAILELANEG